MKTTNLFLASATLANTVKSFDKAALANSARDTLLSGWAQSKDMADASHLSDRLASAGKNVMKLTSEHVTPAAGEAARWASENPGTAAMYGVAGLGLVAVAAPAAIASPALAVVGFGSQGPVAASVAAGVQSGIGSVAASGLFATLQSAAMGGYGVAAVHTAVQVGGAGVALASGGAAFVKSKI